MFGLSNPCGTRESSSLMISKSLGAVWAVECMCYPLEQFVECMCYPLEQFVDDFSVARG